MAMTSIFWSLISSQSAWKTKIWSNHVTSAHQYWRLRDPGSGKPPALGDFGKFFVKIMHFRHTSAIQSKNLKQHFDGKGGGPPGYALVIEDTAIYFAPKIGETLWWSENSSRAANIYVEAWKKLHTIPQVQARFLMRGWYPSHITSYLYFRDWINSISGTWPKHYTIEVTGLQLQYNDEAKIFRE